MALTKPAGTWTYEDLLALPDDGKRYEIIEGVLYEMPPPSWNHAVTIMALLRLLDPIFKALGGELATAPVGVFFMGADPVQPDIIGLLPQGPAAPARRGVEGPPDLVIEVLSPSNRAHDRLTKRALYAQAGVREYWLVDPERRSVEVLSLDRDALRVAQVAAGDETIVSPLLGGAAFPLAAIFARVRGFEAE
jgi:Uma2 family endonuclease